MAQYQVEFLPANFAVGQGGTEKMAQVISGRINQWATQGWELDQVAQISVTEAPGCGCLASLLGIRSTTKEYNCLIFKKP